jgi:hypothetical protein
MGFSVEYYHMPVFISSPMPNQDPYVFGTRGTGINYRKKLWYLTEEGKNNREIKILGLENNLYVLILTDGSGSATEVHGFAYVFFPLFFIKCH